MLSRKILKFLILNDNSSISQGAHSPQNQRELKALPDLVVLPKKGRLSQADRQREDSGEFKLLLRQHSGECPKISGNFKMTSHSLGCVFASTALVLFQRVDRILEEPRVGKSMKWN